jgi:hypothetical protein
MYYDLKLDDWVFEIEETSGEEIANRLMEVCQNHPAALEKVKALSQRVKAIYDDNMGKIKGMLPHNGPDSC